MAEITDVSKLAPDLLNKSTAQLEREIAERQMALGELKRREEEKRRASVIAEIGTRMDRVVEDLKWLHANNALSDNFVAKFQGKDRKGNAYFAPHLSFRKPTE
jgi:hypothetical protein